MTSKPIQVEEEETLKARLADIDREIAWLTPLTEDTPHNRKWGGLKTWHWRDRKVKLEQDRADLLREMRERGIELPTVPETQFEFDVVETRGRDGGLLMVRASPIKGCRHFVSGTDEFKASKEAERQHRQECLDGLTTAPVREFPR